MKHIQTTPLTCLSHTHPCRRNIVDVGPDAVPVKIAPKPPERTSITYSFTSNGMLRELYRNPWDRVRIGKLLEDLDSMAGTVAYKHW